MTRTALIIAHGQPSDPGPAAAELRQLGAKVAGLLPDWQLRSVTLAEDGGLEAMAGAMAPGVIFPMFMAGGWFTRVQIPRRLHEAALTGWRILEPFGCDPALHDLAVAIAAEVPRGAGLILAAHGSFKSRVPSDIAAHVARRIAAETGIARVEAAFIDQPPRLSEMTGFGTEAICLPFFAAAGGHVTADIPEALAVAGFRGRILPPIGLYPAVPALIAEAIRRGRAVCAADCAWKAEADRG
ncbi:MAG: cobalamin biosynthesis protein CbiX [Tabrizicola sp.]|nr:cobalamin biosynthesis protein CbiX [Tabrizicola sp.]